ncbi:hypothetical protein Tco_0578017 [Tanacetum coccineum]
MEPNKALIKDEEAEEVDVHLYKSMIGSLMYITTSRPDITLAVCACERFQVTPKTSHLNAVKRIFRYLKGQPKLGLWYPRDSPFNLEAFSDSDYAGASLDRKSTTGGCQFLGKRLISWQCKKQTIVANSTTEAEYVAAANYLLGKRGRDTKIHQSGGPPIKVGDEAVHKELGDRIERAATTASSYEVEQDSGSGPRCQDTILGDADAQTRFETASIKSNDPPLSREGSEGFHQIVDFRTASHIKYALTEYPKIYVSFIQQFWQTATASTNANGEVKLTARIDGQVKTITEASLRRHLKLEDSDGLTSLPNTEIFEQLTLMRYVSDSDRHTFQKGHLSPQWRFFINTILHCLSPKKTAWEQFSSNIATAIICLVTNRTFNFSKMIFDAMVKNLDSTHKFLMYPRFIQICLNMQRRLLKPHIKTYTAHTLTHKLFNNMKRASKGYSRVDTPLFPTMITTPESSPSRITSLPSLSPQTHQSPQSSPLRDISRQDAGGAATTDIGLDAGQGSGTIHKSPTRLHDAPLLRVNTPGSVEGSLQQHELMDLVTKLTDRVEVLENDLQQTKKVYSSAITKLILKVKKLEKTGRTSADTEVILDQEEPNELVQDLGSGKKGDKEVSTANIAVTTAEVSTAEAEISTVISEVSIAAENLVYIRRSAEKRKDKGKAIMKEDESVQKKTKKQLEQERLRHEEAIRLQE